MRLQKTMNANLKTHFVRSITLAYFNIGVLSARIICTRNITSPPLELVIHCVHSLSKHEMLEIRKTEHKYLKTK